MQLIIYSQYWYPKGWNYSRIYGSWTFQSHHGSFAHSYFCLFNASVFIDLDLSPSPRWTFQSHHGFLAQSPPSARPGPPGLAGHLLFSTGKMGERSPWNDRLEVLHILYEELEQQPVNTDDPVLYLIQPTFLLSLLWLLPRHEWPCEVANYSSVLFGSCTDCTSTCRSLCAFSRAFSGCVSERMPDGNSCTSKLWPQCEPACAWSAWHSPWTQIHIRGSRIGSRHHSGPACELARLSWFYRSHHISCTWTGHQCQLAGSADLIDVATLFWHLFFYQRGLIPVFLPHFLCLRVSP